tara:strand:+ start:18415 stop:19818 length:1404 start_codon:yes stop_codon:yes gene_type:complete
MNILSNIKKTTISFYLLTLIGLGLVSCDKMEDNYRAFIEDGEVTYTPKALDIEGKSGNKRVQLEWNVTSNTNIEKWLFSFGEKTITLDNTDRENAHKVYILEDLEAGDYVFSVQSISKNGSKSLATELPLTVFGEVYRASLLPRRLKSFAYDGVQGLADFALATSLTRNTEVRYISNGEVATVTLEKEDTSIELPDLDFTQVVEFRTFYVPTRDKDGEETTIDEFASDWSTVERPVALETILESVEVNPVLGGALVSWENTDLLNVDVELIYLNWENQEISESLNSIAATNEVNLPFMLGGTQTIKVVVADEKKNSMVRFINVDVVETNYLDRSSWIALEASSEAYDGWNIERMWDGDLNTAWHSPWGGASQYPHHFVIDMGEEKTLTGFKIANKWDDRVPTKTKFEVSTDNVNWTDLGTFNNPDQSSSDPQLFGLAGEPIARYVRVTFVEGVGSEAVIRELDITGI